MLTGKNRKRLKGLTIAMSLATVVVLSLLTIYRKECRNYRQRLFVAAAGQGRLTRMKMLLATGADLDAPACTAPFCVSPLIAAAWGGQTESVELLLDRGANVNSASTRGETALMGPAYHGDTEIVKLLLAKGADVNSADSDG